MSHHILTVLDEVNTLLLSHFGLVGFLTETVNVSGTGSSNGVILLVKGASKGYTVHLSSVLIVVSRDNDSGRQVVLVVVAKLLEHGSSDLGGRVLVVLGGV